MKRASGGSVRKRAAPVIIGAVFVIWFALISAPYLSDGGIFSFFQNFDGILSRPFSITFNAAAVKTAVIMLGIYACAISVFFTTRRNYRRREEHGSARWGDVYELDKKLADSDRDMNKILSKHLAIGFDSRKHRKNLNVLVVGGSGSGKTRFYAKPNIMNANCSFVVLDPKGELVKSVGALLNEKGYDIKILDLISMDKSHCYNPFAYIRDDNDAQRLVTNIFKNTTPKGAQTQDPFWDQAAQMLLLALVFYLHYEAPEEEQNFSMVMEMLRYAAIEDEEGGNTKPSPLDILFDRLAERNPNHIAYKYYKSYHSGSGKTLMSIQITLAARLDKFNLESLEALTKTDELELDRLGDKKMAVFAVIPENDSSFNFIIGLLYTQLFQRLYSRADSSPDGRLKVHVHFVMDEFANVALPDEFDKLLATMRSREISVSIIIQNMAQLKALFEKQWESLVGNCDEFVYLGGNEQSTHEYVSKLLGKETLDINTYGQSKGRNGSYSTNWQLTGRELLDSAEVRLINDNQTMIFVRGERPIMDDKYNVLNHPNVSLTTDGGAKPYTYGEDRLSFASIYVNEREIQTAEIDTELLDDFIFLDNEELENLIEQRKEMLDEKYNKK